MYLVGGFAQIVTITLCLHLFQQCRLSHGNVLGGSGNINGMMYVRGSPHDYDTWANEGCTGWSYKDVLPYFIKAENLRTTEDRDMGQ